MKFSSDKQALAIVADFEKRNIPRARWTHGACLTVALHYCLRFSFDTALYAMRRGVIRLNKANGIANTETAGYHETMTVFWIRTVKRFIDAEGTKAFGELANRLIEKYGDPRLPLKFYSRSRLYSPDARKRFVRPDLREFDLPRTIRKSFPPKGVVTRLRTLPTFGACGAAADEKPGCVEPKIQINNPAYPGIKGV